MDLDTLCVSCFAEKNNRQKCSQCGYQEGTVPESVLHLPPGTGLQDKYLLGRALGQGGFGITYIAWDRKLNLKLAIKEYLPQELAFRTPDSRKVSIYKQSLAQHFTYGLEKYLEEARTLARFAGHPNIVWVRDFFEANGTAYIVMEYIEGVTLKDYLAKKDKPLTIKQVLDIFMPVLDALKEVHAAGILHRDISPDNILLSDRGRVVLIDFGAARQAVGEQSRSLSVIMKAGFSPEEQYHSKGRQGPWTDIYAVAASIYCAITGTVPPESLSRLSEDTLVAPSQLDVKIEPDIEQTLLKALAVRAKDRYQTMDEFQSELIAASGKGRASEGYAEARSMAPSSAVKAEVKSSEADQGQKTKVGPLTEAAKEPAKKSLPAQQPVSRSSGQEAPYTISRKTVKTAALVAACGLLIFSAFSFFGGGDDSTGPIGPGAEDPLQTDVPAVIAALDADYYIDYENGTIFLGELPIGARVADPTWAWEFRTGIDHTLKPGNEAKPVTWIIVAKDHYEGLGSHVTLLAEELIGKHFFDNSTNRGSEWGSNHWGESGTANATRGLRPWLNSTGIHAGEGFYRAFSDSFKEALLITTVTNEEWENGTAYSTKDYVFIPTTTELGDTDHNWTYPIGSAYPYFTGAGDAKRLARLGGETWWYWTRSPDSSDGDIVRSVGDDGGFNYGAFGSDYGVRPALNLKSGILVSEIRN